MVVGVRATGVTDNKGVVGRSKPRLVVVVSTSGESEVIAPLLPPPLPSPPLLASPVMVTVAVSDVVDELPMEVSAVLVVMPSSCTQPPVATPLLPVGTSAEDLAGACVGRLVVLSVCGKFGLLVGGLLGLPVGGCDMVGGKLGQKPHEARQSSAPAPQRQMPDD